MLRIGAHQSVAGRVSRAVDRGVLHGCEAIRARWEQSVAALADELDRAQALGLLGVVIHPGTCTSTEAEALRLGADGIRRVLEAHARRSTMVLLENTAGQGRSLGYQFEHLAAIIDRLDGHPRVGVCLDTCHLLASGYDIVSEQGFQETFREFERLVGFDRLRVLHGNDSKRPLGSRVDRHEHIGEGFLGLEPFRRLMHDPRFDGLPILIETEKSRIRRRAEIVAADVLDMKNLDTLCKLRG